MKDEHVHAKLVRARVKTFTDNTMKFELQKRIKTFTHGGDMKDQSVILLNYKDMKLITLSNR